MNFWQIQAVARRKNRARNDIMGLLENSHQRKRKTKKTQPIIRKQFGIFAKSLTFKVRLNENNEYEPVENGTPKSDGKIVQKPIDRNRNTAKKRNTGKKNGAPVKNRMQEFDVVDLIDDNVAINDADQHGKQMANSKTANDKHETIPPKRTPYPNAVRDKPVPINQNNQNHRNENDFQECDVYNPVDFSQVSVDFTIGTLDVTAQNKMRQRNPLDEHKLTNNSQKSAGSIDFNGFDSHIGADNYKPSADFDNFQSKDSAQSTSNNGKSFCTKVPDGSEQSGWSLNTPSFSKGLNSNAVTETSFQMNKRTEQSIETVLAGKNEDINENDLIGISPFSQCSSCNPTDQRFRFDANTNRDVYNSQQSISSDGLSSFSSCEESTDKNSTFNDFEAPTKVKPFTMSMIIGRKTLGAHRAYERIFGRKTQRQESTNLNLMSNVNRISQQQTNGANRPQIPVKSSVSSTLFCKNAIKKPIQIM